jgi:hypothetical protein
MRRTLVATAGATCVALTLVLSIAAPAIAGQFAVASCQADHLRFSSTAFGDFATRGMKITRACDPDGPGLRGLITANVVQARSVPRGATSIATIAAPAGTAFTRVRWAGSTLRSDCRYTLQVYADAPGPRRSSSPTCEPTRAALRTAAARSPLGTRRARSTSAARRGSSSACSASARGGMTPVQRGAPTSSAPPRQGSASPTTKHRRPRSSRTRRWLWALG